MSVKVIIFDFDGTVADTFDAIVKITNRLSSEFGYKPVTPEELSQIRKMSSREIIKQSGVSIFKLPFILRKLKSELNEQIYFLNFIAGIKETLLELKHRGYQLGIITSNDRENVVGFLKNNYCPDLFDFIYSEANLFGKSKVINKFLKQAKLKRKEIIYVGDETRDIEAAKKSKVPVIAVTWGFNAKEILVRQNPDFSIDYPQQLISAIESLHQPKIRESE